MVQSQTTLKEGSLTLLKFASLSYLLWRLSVPFFSVNGKYKACSFAWAVELSSSFFMKLKQCCSSYPFSPFSWFLANFEVFYCALWPIPISTYYAPTKVQPTAPLPPNQANSGALDYNWSEIVSWGARTLKCTQLRGVACQALNTHAYYGCL